MEGQGKKQVFISYAGSDEKLAKSICEYLEQGGVRCWFAWRDVVGGVDYGTEIGLALDECRLVVLIFTGNTNESDGVRRELEIAYSDKKTVVPYRAEKDLRPGIKIKFYLAGLQQVEGGEKDGLANLLYAVRKTLGQAVPQPTRPGAPDGQISELAQKVREAVALAEEAEAKAYEAKALAEAAKEKAESTGTQDFNNGYGVSGRNGYYAGQWKDRKLDGYGYRLYTDSQDECYGYFSAGVLKGYAVWYYVSKNYFAGHWDGGESSGGYGVHHFTDKRAYKGYLSKIGRDGYGANYNADGSIDCQGLWKDNKLIEKVE